MFAGSFRVALVPSMPLVLAACAAGPSVSADVVDEAKAVISSHEQYAMAGDLDGVMSNVHPEIIVLTVGSPLIQGPAAFRDFYAQLFQLGAWDFTHDYQADQTVGDIVELSGVARGTLTPEGAEPAPFENNFILQLRPDEDGELKVWRAAFAPIGG